MTIKIIALDIDGTLFDSTKKITPKTHDVLLKAQEKGAVLVLASGRPTAGLTAIAKSLEMEKHHGLLVCFNGAKVVDVQTGETLFNQALTVEEGKAVLEHIKKFDVVPMIDKDEYMYVPDVFNNTIFYKGEDFNVMKYESRSNNYILCEKPDLAAFVDFPLNKILTFGQPEYLQEHYKELAEPFPQLSSMFTSDFYYEFTSPGIDKTKALKTVFDKLGYSNEDMIAFGDAQNDKSMVEFAKIGVAMGNATDELKAIADYVTLSNDEDGIAAALYHFMPELND